MEVKQSIQQLIAVAKALPAFTDLYLIKEFNLCSSLERYGEAREELLEIIEDIVYNLENYEENK